MLIAVAILGLAGWLVLRKQAPPVSEVQHEPTRDEEIREILAMPRTEPLSEENKEQIREELTLPRPGGDLSEEEKAKIQEQLQ